MQEWTVTPAERGQRLDKYLRRRLPQAPSSFLYRMLRKKNITLNGRKASGGETVDTEDRVALFLSDETIASFSAGEPLGEGKTEEYRKAYRILSPLMGENPVLYEDKHILLVRKPAGVLSQKGSESDVSVNEWLVGYLLQKKEGGITAESLSFYTPSICTRLDRNTGGILLCACSLQGSRALTELLRGRDVGKYYQAVVCGRTAAEGVLEGYLYKDRDGNMRLTKDSGKANETGAKWSRTSYRLLESGPFFSLLELQLETGRTHQIRVHLSSIGHPIAGDPRYGDSRANSAAHAAAHFKGQLLWCARISFPESTKPELSGVSGKSFVCAPPAFYRTVLESQRRP